MKDNGNTERRLFAVVLLMAILLVTLSAGCAGINFRHMKVGKLTIPDELYVQYKRTVGPEWTGPWQQRDSWSHQIPRTTPAPRYNPSKALRQVNELAAWARVRGYDCEVLIVSRKGWKAHPVLAVELEGKTIYFDPGLRRMYAGLGSWKIIHTLLNTNLIRKES